jgi:3-oxoacyl-[acyl-carrier protein] reductase
MRTLEHKIALVTGGSRGIGKAIVETFAKAGATVIFTYLSNTQAAEAVVNTLTEQGYKVQAIACDMTNTEAVDALVKTIISEHQRIDVLVNNAGITKDNLLLRMTLDQFEHVLRNNLTSVFYVTKLVSRYMLSQRMGSIVNIGSVVGLNGNAGQSNYAAAKAGLVGFTKTVAQEFGSKNIRCNLVAPGFVATDMMHAVNAEHLAKAQERIALKRFAEASEIAQTVLFLASEASSYITGQVLNVCGGMV